VTQGLSVSRFIGQTMLPRMIKRLLAFAISAALAVAPAQATFSVHKAVPKITFVGAAEASAIDGGDATLTLPSNMLPGDFAILCTNEDMDSAGWTRTISDSGGAIGAVCFQKFMGSPVDTTANCNSGGGAGDNITCVAMVFRGVHAQSPIEEFAREADSGDAPLVPSTSTRTAETVIISVVAAATTDTTVTAPAGFENQTDINADDDVDSTTGMAWKRALTTGAQSLGGWSNFTSSDNISFAFVLRPLQWASLKTIQFVGSATDNSIDGTTCVVDLSGLGLVQGDVVVLVGGGSENTSAVTSPGVTWQTLFTAAGGSTGEEYAAGAFWKRMGATPDTSVTSSDPGGTATACAYVAMAWRNVDFAAMDATFQNIERLDDTTPAAQTVVTITPGAVVITATVFGVDAAAITAFPETCSDNNAEAKGNDTQDVLTGVASCTFAAAGSADPDSTSEWSTGTTDDGQIMTIALRPSY
jgi:hypothetical protein